MDRLHSAFSLVIDPHLCHSCDQCRVKSVCRGNAVRNIDPGEPPIIDVDRCWGCRVCVRACPHSAVIRIDEPLPASSN